MAGYWDKIADRLFKIRHCQNIEGVFRMLPLWDPPIDPALLVAATAQGLSLDTVLNDLNTPFPNYRFNYILQKAIELCNDLKSLGNFLLSVLEKKDGEALARMRAGLESALHSLVMEVKRLQLEEVNNALDGLQQNRKTIEYRLKHYLQLAGEDVSKIPTEDQDFSEVPNQLEKPMDQSGLKLIAFEKEEMNKASAAADLQVAVGILETQAGRMNILPNMSIDLKPIGVGTGISFGGSNLGASLQSIARAIQTQANYLSYQSSSAQRKTGFLRQLQDRVFQGNLAGYECKQIDKQILSQKIRISISNQEIINNRKMIESAYEVEEFLKSKYTNIELYNWMEGSLNTLYRQVYALAYDEAIN